MALLKKVEIKGYRSIKTASLELGRLNVLIGANGAGKSNFISFFKMLNEMMAGRMQQFIGQTGRAHSVLHFGPKITPRLEACLDFEANGTVDTYYFRLVHAEAKDTLIFADERLDHKEADGQRHEEPPLSLGSGQIETSIGEWAKKGNDTAKVFRRILDQCRVYHFHDTSRSARTRAFAYIRDNRWLMPDAGNLAAMLYAYRQTSSTVYRRIVSTLKKLLPDFGDFDLEPDRINPEDVGLTWRMRGWEDYLFGPHQLSDGTLRAISIVTLLLQPEADLPDVIILDESELGLHPHALEIVAGLMRAVSVKAQVIVATQSQSFVNYFEPSEIITVESNQGESRFRRLEPNELTDWLEDYSIGELWERNVIGGGPMP